MALDGKILTRAKASLEERRRQHEETFMRRLQKVYAEAPRVKKLDAELRVTMLELVGFALGSDSVIKVDDIRQKNIELQKKRQSEIKQAGFPDTYLNEDYMCVNCHDTGYVKSKMCDCLMELYKEEQKESLSSLFKLGEETFDNFDLTYYDDTPIPGTGISPRHSMEMVFETCIEYARKFGKRSINLFFNGAPGLGKTFLSACIARVVADNGFSVVYDMATSIFTKFEDAKFQRTDDLEGLPNEIKRYMECDLLIVDDLGTEMTTTLTISTLYEIINTRLVTGRKTLVNSNLTLGELHRRYSEQIMSRLEGEYQVLTFYGDDIRKKRNVL